MEQFQKTLLCQQILHDELFKIIEDADPAEIERSITQLPHIFSIEELKVNLSRYYILYDGFERHLGKILGPFIKKKDENNTEKKAQIPKETKEKKEAKNTPENKTENTGNNLPVKEDSLDSSPAEPQSQLKKVPTSGAILSGSGYDQMREKLVHRLSSFENVDSINFKMDYQVEVYANQIDDDLLKKLENIQAEIAPNIPEFRLSVNIRKDRRNDSR